MTRNSDVCSCEENPTVSRARCYTKMISQRTKEAKQDRAENDLQSDHSIPAYHPFHRHLDVSERDIRKPLIPLSQSRRPGEVVLNDIPRLALGLDGADEQKETNSGDPSVHSVAVERRRGKIVRRNSEP